MANTSVPKALPVLPAPWMTLIPAFPSLLGFRFFFPSASGRPGQTERNPRLPWQNTTGQPDHLQGLDAAAPSIVVPEEFLSLASPWPRSQMLLLISGFSGCQASGRGGKGRKRSYAGTDLLRQYLFFFYQK